MLSYWESFQWTFCLEWREFFLTTVWTVLHTLLCSAVFTRVRSVLQNEDCSAHCLSPCFSCTSTIFFCYVLFWVPELTHDGMFMAVGLPKNMTPSHTLVLSMALSWAMGLQTLCELFVDFYLSRPCLLGPLILYFGADSIAIVCIPCLTVALWLISLATHFITRSTLFQAGNFEPPFSSLQWFLSPGSFLAWGFWIPAQIIRRHLLA